MHVAEANPGPIPHWVDSSCVIAQPHMNRVGMGKCIIVGDSSASTAAQRSPPTVLSRPRLVSENTHPLAI